MKPFFYYYGAKNRAAKYYPPPEHHTVIEPFCGSAAYSLYHASKKVLLYDIDPIIVGIWSYLIKVKEEELLALPLYFDHIDEVEACEEAKNLIGFWLNTSTTRPSKVPSAWMKQGHSPLTFWCEERRAIIASQLRFIRHWKCECKSYELIPLQEATWFVDPPYSKGDGKYYSYNYINYPHLSEWCKSLEEQVLVCEQQGAKWLDFKPFQSIKTKDSKETLKEVIWTNNWFKYTLATL